MKTYKLFGLLILAVSILILAVVPGLAKAPGEYKMVLILPGPINDQSWNATNYAGLQACNKDLGTRMEYVENVQPSDYESTLRNYGERGYDLVLAAGTQFDEPAQRVAAKYPKTMYTVINGMVAAEPNLAPVLPKEYEASFLAGLIAGHTTQTGKIGIVGGFPNKLMIRLLNTYEWGARTAKPDLKVNRAYANSWSNVALGKQMASSMIDGGADVLFFYANEVGLGAIQAAKEKGVKFVGFASNQNNVAPGTVVASAYFDFASLYKWTVEKFMAGELKPVVNEVGIVEGIVKIAYSDQVKPEVRDLVDKASKAIADGEFMKFMSEFPEPLE